jgi:hypothetical protein
MSDGPAASVPYVLTLSSRSVTRLLVAIVLTLLAIHLGLQWDRFHGSHTPWEIQQLFDLDEEQSVPNWYSSAALGVAAALAAAIASRARRTGEQDAARWRAVAWILLYLCFDEVAGVHETVNSLSSISWTVPFGLVALVVGWWMLPWVLRLPPATRNGLIVAGIVYVGGAVGIELVSSQFFDESNKRQFVYALNTVVEEGCEMLGVVIAIRTLLVHMENTTGNATIQVETPAPH